jgi:hypothetical protein
MLTTVAALVIVLGLMVSLSNGVRYASEVDLTKVRLRRLDALMAQYESRYNHLPNITPFLESSALEPKEESLKQAALVNNRQVMAALRQEAGASTDAGGGSTAGLYDETALLDAWGMPIVYMAAMHPAIGMAPQNRRFFFSAGPDRRFLTQEDNLYSYEEGNTAPRPPAENVSGAGHSE